MSDRLTIRERIFGRVDRVEDRTLTRDNVPAVMLSSPPAGSVVPSNALAVADAYACVRALADATASLPLHVFRQRADGDRERVESGRAFELLRRPAPAVTTAPFVGQLVAHLNLYGNAYVGKFRRGVRIEQLGLLAPDRVTVEIRGGEPLYRLSHRTGAITTHRSNDIIHVRALGTDGVVGLSPIRQARIALGLSDQLAQHAATFFENSAMPAGVLKLQRFGDVDAQVAELREGFEGEHKGTDKAHRIAVVAGEVDFTALGLNPDDAQFLEQRKLSAVEVARIFRVPPHVIGADPGSSLTYQTAETAALDFAKFSLRPWLVLIEQALSADRDLFPGSAYCEFSLDAILRADAKTRAEFYRAALDPITGWMTRAEVRREENLPPEAEQASASPAVAEVMAAANGNGDRVGAS